jgi:hypothetical protein
VILLDRNYGLERALLPAPLALFVALGLVGILRLRRCHRRRRELRRGLGRTNGQGALNRLAVALPAIST